MVPFDECLSSSNEESVLVNNQYDESLLKDSKNKKSDSKPVVKESSEEDGSKDLSEKLVKSTKLKVTYDNLSEKLVKSTKLKVTYDKSADSFNAFSSSVPNVSKNRGIVNEKKNPASGLVFDEPLYDSEAKPVTTIPEKPIKIYSDVKDPRTGLNELEAANAGLQDSYKQHQEIAKFSHTVSSMNTGNFDKRNEKDHDICSTKGGREVTEIKQ